MSITPDVLEPEFSLTTAATRLDFLSRRDNGDTALNTVRDDDEDSWSSFRLGRRPRSTCRSPWSCSPSARWWPARRTTAGWSAFARRCGAARAGSRSPRPSTSPRSEAWDAFRDSISRQLDDDAATAARELAGSRPS